jgi:hypothetical protein
MLVNRMKIENVKSKLETIWKLKDLLEQAGLNVEFEIEDFRPENLDKTLETLKKACEEHEIDAKTG